jgi:diguanylate cyclase (GGDEF)-like protein/PAS domain S-box-containing protein
MTRFSLLPKYLLITAVVCAGAVAVTSFTLYLLFHASVETALVQSTELYRQRMMDAILKHARGTTDTLAGRLGNDPAYVEAPGAAAVLGRAIALDGASLIVLLDDAGRPLAQAGDPGLLPQVTATAPGETRVAEGAAVSRLPLRGPHAGGRSVGQVFDASITNAEVAVIRDALSSVSAEIGHGNLLWGTVISLGVVGIAGIALVLFARRQVGDLRALTRSARRMSGGGYDEAIALSRADELGQLAATLDQLRERLRTTTISRDYLDRILGSMSESLLLVRTDGVVRRVNSAATRLLEREEKDLVGRPVREIVAATRADEFELADTGGRARETALLSATGQEIPVSYTISAIQDADPAFGGFIVAARNIAERKLAEQRIRYLARIDALTKVPNRMQFQHLIQRAVARSARAGRRFALLYLDIDRFKDINDIYGHSAGDLCLETLTERLARLLPESTVLGRFAGDEFGVLLEDIPREGEATMHLAGVARSILRELARPVPFHAQEIHMTASIGIATFPVDARNVIDLVRSADSALYHAKRAGGDTFEFFDPEMNAMAAERLMLKSKLRRAYEREELLLQYQPKVDLATGRIAGAEALVRWDLSDRGIVLPSEFIPLAEESNLILDIGEWVLDRVCRDFRDWQAQQLFPGKIAVNLSLKQLRQPNFSQRVGAIFRKHGVPPASLELEITESTLMENPERTVRTLDELYAMGLTLAIDDFGTGYSSLSALQKFPISTLKIDRSFVVDAAVDADDATIVTTIIRMGHGLDLDVIAEGVESAQQLDFLRGSGCDYAQGLLFGEPTSAADLAKLLAVQRQGEAAFAGLVGNAAAARAAAGRP